MIGSAFGMWANKAIILCSELAVGAMIRIVSVDLLLL